MKTSLKTEPQTEIEKTHLFSPPRKHTHIKTLFTGRCRLEKKMTTKH